MNLGSYVRIAVRAGLFIGPLVLALEASWILATGGGFLAHQLGLGFAFVRYAGWGALLGMVSACVAWPVYRRLSPQAAGALLLSGIVAAFAAAEIGFYVFDIWAPLRHAPRGRLLVCLAIALTVVVTVQGTAFVAVRAAWRRLERLLAARSWSRITFACVVESVCLFLLLHWVPFILSKSETAVVGGAKRPNVLLIVLDTVRADALSCSGNSATESPSLDRLAAEGVRFARATSPATWTPPGHASLFTGLYPLSHGTRGMQTALSKDVDVLPAILAREGYATVSLYNNPLAGRVNALARGFDVAIGVETDTKVSLTDERLYYKFVLKDSGVRRTMRVLRAWLDAHGRGQPWFAFLNLNDAHAPYVAREPWMSEFLRRQGIADGQVNHDAVKPWLGMGAMPAGGSRDLAASLGDAEFRWLRAAYYSQVRNLDQHLGVELQRMRREGILGEDTIVIVTSDHGEALGEDGEVGHARRLVASVVRIPMIFWWPEHLAPRVDEGWVSLVDVVPTLLGLLELRYEPASYAFEGRDLFSSEESGEAVAEHTAIDQSGCDSFLLLRKAEGLLAECGQEPVLVRVPADSLTRWEREERNSKVLDAWHADLTDWKQASLANYDPKTVPTAEIAPAAWERLRALGYVK